MHKSAPREECASAKYFSYGLYGSLDDGSEGSGLKGSATYESTVDVRLAHELSSILRLHGTTVLQAYLVSSLSTEGLSNHATDEGVCALSVSGGSRHTRTDSPHGLVSDYQTGNLLSGQALKPLYHLRLEHGLKLATLALLQRLTDAVNRADTGGKSLLNLLVDVSVRLTVVLAAESSQREERLLYPQRCRRYSLP